MIWQILWRIVMESSNVYSFCRSETNGIAEWAVRRAKEETSAVLLQSGSDDKWWSDSMKCCYYLRDDQDLLADGKTQNERRLGNPSRTCFVLGGEFGKKILWLLRLMNSKVGCIRNRSQKTECERSLDNHEKMKNLYFLWQMVQHNYQEETTNSKNPPWNGNPQSIMIFGLTQKLGKTYRHQIEP